jgi:uncharacterized membrane protein (DUF2068 family)
MSKERPGLLTLFAVLVFIQAISGGIHYILIYLGVIPADVDIARVTEFAFPDVIVGVIPSLIGTFGLWRLKLWGWMLTMISNGGYLHGVIASLTYSLIKSEYRSMNFVSIYFVLFSILLIIYLWQQRKIFN